MFYTPPGMTKEDPPPFPFKRLLEVKVYMSSFINIGLLTKEPGGRMNLCRAKGMPVDANFICFLYKLDIPDKFGVEILWAPVGGGVST